MTKPKKLSIHQLLQDIHLTTMDLPTQPPQLSNLSMVLLLLLPMPLLMLLSLNLYTKEHKMVKILLNLILTHGFILTLTHTSIDFLTEESRMHQRETHTPHHKVKLHLQLHGTKLTHKHTHLAFQNSKIHMMSGLEKIQPHQENLLLLHKIKLNHHQHHGIRLMVLVSMIQIKRSTKPQSKSQLLKRSLML
jgi:hypothetical protein